MCSLNAISYLRTNRPTPYWVSEALLGGGVSQEAMSTTCICLDTQNGKFSNTFYTQIFEIFGSVINNDT